MTPDEIKSIVTAGLDNAEVWAEGDGGKTR